MNKYQEAINNIKTAPSFMGGNIKYQSVLESSIPFLEDIAILQELVDKESKYQALEEELGCPLDVREKALDSFYCPKFENDKKLLNYYVYAFNNEELFIRLIYSQYDEYYNEETNILLKDYKKTWALCKEDLKSE